MVLIGSLMKDILKHCLLSLVGIAMQWFSCLWCCQCRPRHRWTLSPSQPRGQGLISLMLKGCHGWPCMQSNQTIIIVFDNSAFLSNDFGSAVCAFIITPTFKSNSSISSVTTGQIWFKARRLGCDAFFIIAENFILCSLWQQASINCDLIFDDGASISQPRDLYILKGMPKDRALWKGVVQLE